MILQQSLLCGVSASAITAHLGGGGGGDEGNAWRIVRVSFNASSSNILETDEIEFLVGGVNMATGTNTVINASVLGSSSWVNGTAQNGTQAFKGNDTTWLTDGSNTYPQWVQYDFGPDNKQVIEQATIKIGSYSGRTANSITFQFSNDGVNFTDGDTFTGLSWTGYEKKTFTLTSPDVPEPPTKRIAPVIESCTVVENASAATVDFDLPAGTENGDLLVIFASAKYNAVSVTGPDDWTVQRNVSGFPHCGMFTKLITDVANEPASYSVTFGGARPNSGAIYRISSVDTSDPVSGSSVSSAINGTSIGIPPLSSEPDCLFLAFLKNGDVSTGAATMPYGMTEDFNSSDPQNLIAGAHVVSEVANLNYRFFGTPSGRSHAFGLAIKGKLDTYDSEYRYYRIFFYEPKNTEGGAGTDAYITLRKISFFDKDDVDISEGATSAEVSASSEYSSTYAAEKAFDTDNGTSWSTAVGDVRSEPLGPWIQFDAGEPVLLDRVELTNTTAGNTQDEVPNAFAVVGSLNGLDWTPIGLALELTWGSATTNSCAFVLDVTFDVTTDLAKPGKHQYWRILIHEVGDDSYASVGELWLYGGTWGTVDLTTFCGGTASAKTIYSSTYAASKAFDRNIGTDWSSATTTHEGEWLKWDFGTGNEQEVEKIAITAPTGSDSDDQPTLFDFQWSDDDTNWHSVQNGISTTSDWTSGAKRVFTFPPIHRYWRVNFKEIEDGSSVYISQMVFIEAKTYKTISVDGTPISGSSFGSNTEPFIYDSSPYGTWGASISSGLGWLGYDFGEGVRKEVGAVGLMCYYTSQNGKPRVFDIDWSDDGTTWSTLYTVNTGYWPDSDEFRWFWNPKLENPEGSRWGTHEYWRLLLLSAGSNSLRAIELQWQETPGGPNVAVDGTPSQSSTYSTHTADQAYDGSFTTYSETSTASLWTENIAYQFSEPVSLVQLSYWPSTDSNIPRVGMMQFSDDGGNWNFAWTWEPISKFSTGAYNNLIDPSYVANLGIVRNIGGYAVMRRNVADVYQLYAYAILKETP